MPPKVGNPDRPDGAPFESLREGRYQVLGTLGVGSQAQTLEARDIRTGTRVAVKRFVVRGKKSWKEVELAEREAAVLSQLQHPNLPRYLEHFEEAGVLYLVMEKIEGKTLAELRRTSSLSQSDILGFLHDAARILSYLHGRSPPIIHRDIKPENVIQRPDGSFALVDFGSVRDRLRPEGGSTVVGTFGYMAPEQFQGRALPTTDVYGVGATAMACLTGTDPEKLPHRGLAIDVPRALGAKADPRFVELLSGLLEPDPDRRVPDLAQALRKTLRDAVPTYSDGNFSSEKGRARDDERRLRSELKEARRRRKRERAQRRSRQSWKPPREFQSRRFRGVGALLWLLLPILLLVARLANFGLFRLFLPVSLGILALVFGAGLERSARRCAEIGRAFEIALRRASSRLSGRDPPPSVHEDTTSRPRQRVSSDSNSRDPEPYKSDVHEEPSSKRRRV